MEVSDVELLATVVAAGGRLRARCTSAGLASALANSDGAAARVLLEAGAEASRSTEHDRKRPEHVRNDLEHTRTLEEHPRSP